MRKVVYGVACSLDGFLARSDGSVDWLRFTADAKAVMQASWSRFDAVLMGRRTWEAAASSGGGGGGGGGGGMRSYIFSRTLPRAPKGAELVRDDVGAFVRDLKNRPGKDICLLGGGDLARSLLAAGVVDELGLNVHPLLLGSGVPLLAQPHPQFDLQLDECRQMAAGCVLLNYRVAARAG